MSSLDHWNTAAASHTLCILMRTIDTDILIFGGGIAGLWTLNRLRREGYEAILLESGDLGDGQTLRSQGIIHGGMKYALTGMLNSETEAIADMPSVWRRCLTGDGDVDLRGVKVISETQYMWSEASMASRFTTFFASKLLRGRIEALKPQDYPSALKSPRFHGSVYRLNDIVLDTHSLIETLAMRHKGRIYKVNPQSCHLEADDHHNTKAVFITAAGIEPLRIHANAVVLAAGKGNQELMADIGLRSPRMQLRPLHMVLMKHPHPGDFFAHCVGTSSKPRLTITTHRCADGESVWYIGGEIAESGVNRDERLQIEMAQRELRDVFPWLDWRGARFKTLRIDRAEPAQENFLKPDNAYAEMFGNNIIAWPTKMTLAPNLGEHIVDLLKTAGVKPQAQALEEPLPLLFPEIGTPVWDKLFA